MNKSVCLNMIVKDEGEIIQNTLKLLVEKIKIDYYTICDTGSTDNTIELIETFFNKLGINGEIHKTEWKDFGYNRSVALELARNKCDYTFIFDADDYIVGDLNLNYLEKDSYKLKFGNEHHVYERKILVKSSLPWRFVGILHECINCEINTTEEQLPGDYYIVSGRTSSRNKNPNKYLDDAKILEKGYVKSLVLNDGLHSRYSYYCANSYLDAGIKDKAVEWYKKTLTLSGWFDEKYNSCIKLYELLDNESRFYYLVKSYTFNPRRVEGILELIKHYTCEKNYDIAWRYYTLIQEYYENEYFNSDGDLSTRLFARIKDYSFFLPYYMIIVCERLKKYDTCVFMLGVILHRKSYENQWFFNNLFFNVQFFKDYLTQEVKNKIKEYIDSMTTKGLQPDDSWKNIKLDFLLKPKLLFYTGFAGKPWNISLNETQSIGGSERAVAYLSQKLTSNYTVYLSGDIEPEIKNGVICVNRNSLNVLFQENIFDIIVISRYVSFFTIYPNFNCKKLYIMAHDTYLLNNLEGCKLSSNEIVKNNIEKLTGVVCLTRWHKNNYLNFSHPELHNKVSVNVINNGIEPNLFTFKTTKHRNSFVFTSCSERGLLRLVELWGDILQELPDAKLTITSYELFPGKSECDNKIKSLIDQFPESIQHLGRLPQKELYQLMARSEYWLYPCCFHETSCITAMEMLMSEVICLYYPLAGLTDTLGEYGIKVSSGNEIETILNLSERQKAEFRKKGKSYAMSCSWENKSREWINLFGIHKHLESISQLRLIPGEHINFVKSLNTKPRIVYDIGSCVLHWTNMAKDIFTDSQFVLFEAMDEVEFLYKGYNYNLGVLSDSDNKEIDFYQNLEFPGGNSYYQEIGHPDSEKLFKLPVKKTAMTLSTVVKTRNFPLPDLVKIDVQGCELDILKGGMDVINNAEYLIVELQNTQYNKNAPLANETITFLNNNGWILVGDGPFCDNGPDGDYCFKRNEI